MLQEVSLDNNQVRLGAGFSSPISVPILFEETFYNEKEQAYSILCISRPLDSDHSPGIVFVICLMPDRNCIILDQ